MALYCGQSIGDLIVITLNNAVEVALAIILLTKCRLRLLQATLVGVVVLHLLLVPGAAFLTGGAKIWQQHLHEHPTQLNHVILTMGVVTLLLPAAFFAAMNEPSIQTEARATAAEGIVERSFATLAEYGAVSDETRAAILKFSRGLSFLLLIVYVCSRIYLHNPPGDGNALTLPPNATHAEKNVEKEREEEEPDVNPWAGLFMIVVTVGIMAATAEWLLEAIEFIVGEEVLTEEWLGLVLLPFVSFAGDGFVAVGYFILKLFRYKTVIPEDLAKGRAIDMSIQFLTLWMPFLVLLSWWIDKPLSLLFDTFEVVILTGSCFLVNYVTADAKTNWAEGLVMVIFYVMIAVTAWFYPGQQSHGHLVVCPASVAASIVGASTALWSAGLAIFIPWWLYKHQPQGLGGYEAGIVKTFHNGTFIVDESYAVDGRAQEAPLRGLIFSSLAVHTISLTNSFLMAVVAYCIASLWLEASRCATEGPSITASDYNITPAQYGLLLSILGSPGIMSVFNGVKYSFRSKGAQRSKLPSIFIEPLIMAGILLFLNYAIGTCDLWLHSVTRSTAATLALANTQGDSDVKFGVTLNNSLCAPQRDDQDGKPILLDCLDDASGWASGEATEWIMPNSWLVMYNISSAAFRVVTLHDDFDAAAVVSTIPRPLGPLVPSSFTYNASTIAVTANCKVITDSCARDAQGRVTDCSTADAPYLPLKWNASDLEPEPGCEFDTCTPNRIFAVLEGGQIGSFVNNTFQTFGDPTGNSTPPAFWSESSPGTLGMQLRLRQDRVVYRHPSQRDVPTVDSFDTLFATCQINYSTGMLSYDPGRDRYVLSEVKQFSPQQSFVLLGPLISQYGTNRLIADVLGPIMADPQISPSSLIGANLARVALGLLGGVMQPTNAFNVVPVKQGVLGLYPLAPVLCVVSLLYLYAFFALFVFFALISSTSYTVSARHAKGDAQQGDESSWKEEKALVLGQLWLTNPLPLVASVFAGEDGKDPQRSTANSSLDMVFDEEGKVDYLAIGTTSFPEEMKFGISRRGRTFFSQYKY
ncbi:hypothetical protein FRB90_001423 [Tulasnella sp. 427]|nr:hypothetical protein FRB90_001423 [Tulasnella sp. 427]